MTQLFFSDYDIEPAETPLPLVIFGAGGLGREVLLLIQQLNEAQPTWQVRGFYDDRAPAAPTVCPRPVPAQWHRHDRRRPAPRERGAGGGVGVVGLT
jgi:hypothetical protein